MQKCRGNPPYGAWVLASAIALALSAGAQGQTRTASGFAAEQRSFDIPAGPLAQALSRFSEQSGIQALYEPGLVQGRRVEAVRETATASSVLTRLLDGSGLVYEFVDAGTVVLKRAEARPVPEGARARPRAETREQEIFGLPAIMVQGARTLNMDIARTRDDPQPYVVFERGQIERSGATSLEQFLQQRLTMNTSRVNTGAGGAGSGVGASTSQISLRGLGSGQTLILIDGHRVSSSSLDGAFGQMDINGLPLAAIERIEVLPTTASGIYGGSATGGVINIIMRRDYTGAEVKFTYDNTFSTDTATRKLDIAFGHGFNAGRTNLLATVNYSDANDLLVGDRGLTQRGQGAIQGNYPDFFVMPNGLPPLASRPNIASIDGSELMLKDGTALGAAYASVPAGYAGTWSDAGAALAANAGTYNWDLADSMQANGGRRQAFYTQPTVKSGGVVLRHQFDEGLQVYTDLSYSNALNRFPTSRHASHYYLPGWAPNNPFMQDIYVSLPVVDSGGSISATEIGRRRALAGMIKQLPRDWQLGADYTWDRTTVTYGSGHVSPAFASDVMTGAIDVLRDTMAFPVDVDSYTAQATTTSPFRSTMHDASLRAGGPLWTFPGGASMLSASMAYREESVPDAFDIHPGAGTAWYYPARSQAVTSAYAELRVPVFSEANARAGLRGLELQAAVRRDHYVSRSGERITFRGGIPDPMPDVRRSRNEFVSVDPTFALRWEPWKDLAVRASYGTGFLPPALNQLVPNTNPTPGCTTLIDPRRGNTPSGPCTLISGGNPDLRPETSESWSAGFIYTPDGIPSLRISVDYTRIGKKDNIAAHPLFYQGLLNDEALFPDRVIRGERLPGDPPEWAGPIEVLDFSVLNLARTELEAWDVQLDFTGETDRFGVFDFFFMGTWQPHFRTQTVQGLPFAENAGVTSGNPLKFKANVGVVWSLASWRAGWSLSHYGPYSVGPEPTFIRAQGAGGRVSSQTYNDVFVDYDFGLSGRTVADWLAGTVLQLGVRNVFDKMPPLDVGNAFGFYSRFGDPRMASYYLSIKTSF